MQPFSGIPSHTTLSSDTTENIWPGPLLPPMRSFYDPKELFNLNSLAYTNRSVPFAFARGEPALAIVVHSHFPNRFAPLRRGIRKGPSYMDLQATGVIVVGLEA